MKENYLQVRDKDRYKRMSLKIRNCYIAQKLYNAYLLDKVKNKITSLGFQEKIDQHSSQESIPNKTIIKPLYQEYLETCKIKGLEKATLRYKEVLLTDLISFKIIYLEDINQQNISPLIKFSHTIFRGLYEKIYC